MKIKDYGWNEYFQQEWSKSETAGLIPGRVIADYGQSLCVASDNKELYINRSVRKQDSELRLAVGDWVALELIPDSEDAYIRFALPRRTKFSRAASGIEVKEQLIAANVDTVFLVQSLNRDFNMRRLERYLVAAWESGAEPVVVLTKADCCDNVIEKMVEVYNTAPGVEVHSVSCYTGDGIEPLKKYLTYGKTVALLGSSGVGKSTLVNTLAGKEILKTQEIREGDSKGRHTTTHREIVLLPEGGMILDTPGMRSLSLWEADTGMEVMFGDVEELVAACRFSDCCHRNEPGCRIREALHTGELSVKRWESWIKIQRELVFLEAKKDDKIALLEKQRGKQIDKYKKSFYKGRL